MVGVVGAVFFVYTLLVHVDLAAVRTGPLVFYSLLAAWVAALLILIQIPVVVFVLVCRPGITSCAVRTLRTIEPAQIAGMRAERETAAAPAPAPANPDTARQSARTGARGLALQPIGTTLPPRLC